MPVFIAVRNATAKRRSVATACRPRRTRANPRQSSDPTASNTHPKPMAQIAASIISSTNKPRAHFSVFVQRLFNIVSTPGAEHPGAGA